MRMRDVLGAVFTDDEFAAVFPSRGRPAISSALLAFVSVLQFGEGLTDRQAAHAVRARIDWKYALGLELDDTGFDHRCCASSGHGWWLAGWSSVSWTRCWKRSWLRGW
ncbi:MAG: transposase [Pseudonocardiaceae bacterium]